MTWVSTVIGKLAQKQIGHFHKYVLSHASAGSALKEWAGGPYWYNLNIVDHSLIDGMIEMTFNALTNAGKHVTSKTACACSQRNKNDLVFWLAHMTCVMTLRNFPPFVKPNVISYGPTNGFNDMSIV